MFITVLLKPEKQSRSMNYVIEKQQYWPMLGTWALGKEEIFIMPRLLYNWALRYAV